MMSAQADSAIVLHSRRYRENSRIVELFSEQHGRFSALARVSERQAQRTPAQLQVFSEVHISWTGRSELKSLRTLDLGTAHYLAGERSVCGLYCNELLLLLTPKEAPMPEFYPHYRQTLQHLAADLAVAPVLRRFEQRLLDELGSWPDLGTDCVSGEDIDPDAALWFHPAAGISNQCFDRASMPLSGAALRALWNDELDAAATASEIRRLCSACINRLLNGRPLQSRELIRTMSRKST